MCQDTCLYNGGVTTLAIESSGLRRRYETITLGSMYAGYAGLVLCQTALGISSSSMIKDGSLTAAGYGDLVAYGAGGALLGKLTTGVLADRIGGRRMFLLALSSMASVTVLFGATSVPALFMLLGFAAQFVKASGWPSFAKLISAWFDPARYGRVWGIVSTSSRASSVLSGLFLSTLLFWLSWHWLFYVAGTIAGLLVVGLYYSMREQPADVGLSPPETSALETSDASVQTWESTLMSSLAFFAGSAQVWLICGAIMTLTLQMEFLSFLPQYMNSTFEIDDAWAGIASSAFPAGSFIALLVGGVLFDKMPRHKLPLVLGSLLAVGLLSVAALIALSGQETTSSVDLALAIAAIFVFGFSISPVYYIPMSVFSIEFGRTRSGVLVGIIDAFGYGTVMVVAPLAGRLVQHMSDTGQGWIPFLTALAGVSVVSLVLMPLFLTLQARSQ